MFAYDFMTNAFAAAGIVAMVSGLVGFFLVMRGQTFAGHALSHIGFAGATQDIVIDAWRIETAGESDSRQAVMATATAWGSRIAPFVSGIVPLMLADTLGWGFAYALMAGLMVLGVIAVLLAPKEAEHKVRPIDYGDAPSRPALEAFEWAGRLVLMFAAICLMGVVANVGIAGVLFDRTPIWWLAGAAGAVIGAVWNYAMASTFTWKKA